MSGHRSMTALAAALAISAASLAAQSPAPAQPRPPQTYSAFLQAQYASLKRYIIGSAEKMPAEHFPFKPAPEVMTYAGLLGHIIDVQTTASATRSRAAPTRPPARRWRNSPTRRRWYPRSRKPSPTVTMCSPR